MPIAHPPLPEPWRSLHKRLIVAAAALLAQRHWGEPIKRPEAEEQDEAITGLAIELRRIADEMSAASSPKGAALPEGVWISVEQQPIPTSGLVDLHTDTSRYTGCYYDHICDEWRLIDHFGKLVHIKRRWILYWMKAPASPIPKAPQESA